MQEVWMEWGGERGGRGANGSAPKQQHWQQGLELNLRAFFLLFCPSQLSYFPPPHTHLSEHVPLLLQVEEALHELQQVLCPDGERSPHMIVPGTPPQQRGG